MVSGKKYVYSRRYVCEHVQKLLHLYNHMYMYDQVALAMPAPFLPHVRRAVLVMKEKSKQVNFFP